MSILDPIREHKLFFTGMALSAWAILHILFRTPSGSEREGPSTAQSQKPRDAMLELPMVPKEDLLPPFPTIPSAIENRPEADQAWVKQMRQIRPPDDLIGLIPPPPGGWAAKTNAVVNAEDLVVVKPAVLAEMKRKGELEPMLQSAFERAREQTLKNPDNTGMTLEELQKLRNEGALIVQ